LIVEKTSNKKIDKKLL